MEYGRVQDPGFGGVGQDVTLLGRGAVSSGAGGISIGYQAGCNTEGITIGSNSNINTQKSVVIGSNSSSISIGDIIVVGSNSRLTNGNESILIGNDSSSIDATNSIFLGQNINSVLPDTNSLYTTTGLANLTSTALHYDTTTGKIGPTVSSSRFKENIRPIDIDTSKIYSLQAKSFDFKETGEQSFGFIAEEVVDHIPELVSLDKDGNPFSINYDLLSVLQNDEMRKMAINVDSVYRKISELDARTSGLEGDS